MVLSYLINHSDPLVVTETFKILNYCQIVIIFKMAIP